MSTRMLQRRGLASEWAATNPILGEGEIGFETDTGTIKVGDGVTHWVELTSPYATTVAIDSELATKADLVGGIIPTSQLPAITTGQIVTVASQAEMLALTAAQVQPGDVAIRSDQSGHRWLLADTDPSILSNWIALEVPDAVSSVNGQAGAVVLNAANVGAQPADADLTTIAGLDSSTSGVPASDGAGWIKKTYAQLKTALGLVKADVGLSNVDNTSDVNKPVSTAQQTALNGKQPLASQLTSIAGLVLAGQAAKVLTVKADASGYELDTPSAGGGSGIPPTIVDALGDLIVGTANDTVGRLGRGSTGQRLTVQADGTLAWTTPYTGADKVTKTGDTMTGELTVPDLNVVGLTGATATSRYVGGTTAGAPISGTFNLGDFVIDQSGAIWLCVSAGSPGGWNKIAANGTQGDSGSTILKSGTVLSTSGSVNFSSAFPSACTAVTMTSNQASATPVILNVTSISTSGFNFTAKTNSNTTPASLTCYWIATGH